MRLPASLHLGPGSLQQPPDAGQVVDLEAEVVHAGRVRRDGVRDEVELDAGVGGGEPDPAEVGDLGRHRHLVDAEDTGVEAPDRVGLTLGEGRGDVLQSEHGPSLPRRAQRPSIPSARSNAARAASPGVSPYSSTHAPKGRPPMNMYQPPELWARGPSQ